MMFVVVIMFLLWVLALLMLGGWGYTAGRIAEDCCATCKYPTAGLLRETCPECGSDLRGSGTRRTGDRDLKRPALAIIVACRSVVVAIPLLIMYAWASHEFPRGVSWARATAASGSGLFEDVWVVGHGTANVPRRTSVWGLACARSSTRATLKGPGGLVSLKVRDAAVRATYGGPDGRVRTADGLTEADVVAWMDAAGVDVATPVARQEARAVLSLIQNVVCGGGAQSMITGKGCFTGLKKLDIQSDVYETPNLAAVSAIGVVGAVMWGGAMWPLWKERRAKAVGRAGAGALA